MKDRLTKYMEKIMSFLSICERINIKEDKVRISSSITNSKWLSYYSISLNFFSTFPIAVLPAPFPCIVYSSTESDCLSRIPYTFLISVAR